ncbi:MAG: hypothetical protein Q9222_004325 [Ikaeria aurantiellina]
MSDETHFLERKMNDFKRLSAKGYICPYCTEGFIQESRLWDHAKRLHRSSLEGLRERDEGQARTQFREKAAEKASRATRKSIRESSHTVSQPLLDEFDPSTPDIGGEIALRTPSIPTLSQGLGATGTSMDPSQKIDNFGNLTLEQDSGRHGANSGNIVTASPVSNPLKRGLAENLELQQVEPRGHPIEHPAVRARRDLPSRDFDTARGLIIPKDGHSSRNSFGSMKPMPSPGVHEANHSASLPRNTLEQAHGNNWSADARGHHPRPLGFPPSHKESEPSSPQATGIVTGPISPVPVDKPVRHAKAASVGSRLPSQTVEIVRDTDLGPPPQMLLQPETRPISHAQLVVEVKGIYAGLVMVEAKCIEVDEKQSAAALERDPTKRTDLKDEQWQALIALHKTLLHEHHDFFLASQHPSASPALSKLAGKYTMPARMWRHGIHAFLEVLRHRLPASLDHMLAFIYIAYSMMALLYETVTTFEDTWIECLGDLGRYRMAIEDSSSGDREIWGGVARAWYNKAADKRPYIGRLYHHLAILARPYSLQQLAYYTRSLASIELFDSTRGSIMTLFQPVLDGKTFGHHRNKALEIAYIRVHAILFDRPQHREAFEEALSNIRNGLLDSYIDRVTANFKEQGVYIAIANIAALFEYGGSKPGQKGRPVFWRAFVEYQMRKDQEMAVAVQEPAVTAFSLDNDPKSESIQELSPKQAQSPPSPADLEASSSLINKSSALAFTTLSIALRRHGDKNVFPFIHVMFVFLWNLANIESAMEYVRADVPWGDVCSFLNTLAKPETMTPTVLASETFPKADDKIERPLPEDYFMRGQRFLLEYLPKRWCVDNSVDEEERMLELPSMTASRVDRILWLGVQMAKVRIKYA